MEVEESFRNCLWDVILTPLHFYMAAQEKILHTFQNNSNVSNNFFNAEKT